MVLLLCVYSVWNTFISVSNPSLIRVVDGVSVGFSAYGRSHIYMFDQINRFAMRPVAGGTRLYMTINGGKLFKGRYWVRVSEFSDSKELEDFFYDLDAKVNPDSLVTRARKEGRKRLKNEEEKP